MPDTRLIKQPQRRTGLVRWTRIVWRDTWALWSEFRLPILLFGFVTIVGGYFYGELYWIAREETIALVDRPYYMMQLMILETPEPAPPEWYLVAFWYGLPIVFVLIIGLGAAEFLHLFFNRGDRREAWREAVASTYRDHVIVFGAGHVGMRVLEILVSMNLDIVVIDNSPDEGVEDALVKWNIPLIVGDGRIQSTLEKAGLDEAESFVACTGNDHVNLEAIMKVRHMNPEIRIVARVWDSGFAEQISEFMNVETVFSSSDLAAPAFAGAALGIEITQTLNVEGVDYSMIRLQVKAGGFLDGRDVGALQKSYQMDIVLHERGAKVDIQPPHDLIVQAGDTLVIFSQHERVMEIVSRNHNGTK